jgi:hypothetical protein
MAEGFASINYIARNYSQLADYIKMQWLKDLQV